MILVTGGAGYIGSHAVRALQASGFETLVFDNFSTGHRDFVAGTAWIEGDVCSSADLAAAFRTHAIEGVLHFAGKALVGESYENPGLYYETNVTGGVRLLEAMKIAGVRNIVFSSTCATYGSPESTPIREDTPQRPINPYGESKLAFEKALRWFHAAHGIQYLALRYFNAAGASPDGSIGEDHFPETHLIPHLLDVAMGRSDKARVFGTDYPTPDGTCIRDYIHVLDLATAHVLGLRKLLTGEIEALPVNLGTGSGFSVKEILEAARQATALDIPAQELPRRGGDPPVLVAEVGRAHEVLGWKATESSIERIMSTAWSWHRHRFGPKQSR